MNGKVLFHFIAEKISHNNIMQQHLLNKYSFQGVPNQVDKLRKFQGVGGKGMISKSGGSTKQKLRGTRGWGGGGVSIFSRTTYTCCYTCWWFYVTVVYRYLQGRPVTTSAYERLVSSSWQRQYYHYYYYYFNNK